MELGFLMFGLVAGSYCAWVAARRYDAPVPLHPTAPQPNQPYHGPANAAIGHVALTRAQVIADRRYRVKAGQLTQAELGVRLGYLLSMPKGKK